MDKLRFTLTDRFGALIIAPLGVDDIVIEYTREQEDSRRDYNKVLQGSLVLKGEAYSRLIRIEKSVYRCTEQYILMERLCEKGTYKEVFNGVISLNNADFDLDNCFIDVRFTENTPYKCLDDIARDKINILAIQVPVEVRLTMPDVVLEKKRCTGKGLDPDRWCGPGKPEEGMWAILKSETVYTPTSPSEEVNVRYDFTWCRETIEVPCGEHPGDGWEMMNVCYGGKEKYARFATIINKTTTQDHNEETGVTTFYENGTAMAEDSDKKLRNGRTLKHVLEQLTKEACGLKVVSDFFQINPVKTSVVNYVTGRRSTTDNVIVFQKSDVKRGNAANVATKGELNFEDLMEFLKMAFNVDYRLEANNLIIEHVSFFNKTKGFDLTEKVYDRYTNGTRKYNYKSDEIPSVETWEMKESSLGDFGNKSINYYGACVTNKGKNEKKYSIDEYTTDVELVISNPASDSNIVEDSGFVIVSAREIGGQYYINSTAISSYGNILNNVFALTNLIKDFHYHERPLIFGKIAGKEVVFKSAKPIKKGVPITIPFYCKDYFNPDDYIKTSLGNGVVDKASFDVNSGTLEVELLYQVESGLEQNDKPIVNNYTRTTYRDKPIVIDLMVGASDPQGNETLRGYKIINYPTKGALKELNKSEVLYTPNEVGQDMFTFVVYDEWDENSNTALCSITVREVNKPPIANDNHYEGYSSDILEIDAKNGLFSNDSHEYGFKLKTYDKKSEWGADVFVDKDGSFTYKPIANKYGIDTFNYTIEDEQGMTDSAIVYITMKDKTQLVAGRKVYITKKNEQIIANGSEPNDTLIRGILNPSNKPITITEDNKQTEKGGSVIISENGHFTYSPAANFVGKDTFVYTAKTEDSSINVKAEINVIENLFVVVRYENRKREDIIAECNNAQTILGEQVFEDIILAFFKDVQMKVPYDVTDLGLKVNLRTRSINNGNDFHMDNYTIELKGTQQTMYNSQRTRHREKRCGSSDYMIDLSVIFSVQDGQGYTKI